MKKFLLTCSSTVDLSNEYLKTREIEYVKFNYQIDDKLLKDDLGLTITSESFYEMMRQGAQTKTSQINANEYIDFFTPHLKNGYDILHIEISSGLSGSLNSAHIALDILKEEFKERKIIIVDSLSASAGFGLLVDKAADLRDSGKNIDEVARYINDNKKKLNHWFYSTDLSYYVKGGRISSTAGLIGGLLSLCPVLHVSDEGRLTPKFKVIGKKRAINKVIDQMELNALDGLEYSDKCFISHADCLDDALLVSKKIEEKFKNLKGKVEIFNIGTTIGSHTGPGTLALFFWGNSR